MHTIMDGYGNVLAEAWLRATDDGQNLLADRVSRGARLVRFYFQEGGRHVSVLFDEQRLEGRLATRWAAGKRTWVVHLEGVVAPAPPARPFEAPSQAEVFAL